ncbi:MAG: hypothetical protein K0S53_903 [Bacteroidetes bacterium]|jgi:hypothetical protein|nr:hypothetical protein [Bacteroidota bacterium]
MLLEKSIEEVDVISTEICEAFTIKFRSDGIIHSHTTAGIDFNVDSLKKFSVVMGKMVNYRSVPLLITLDEFAIPPVETRAFWATKESCPYSSADAYVTSNMGHAMIGNFYLKFNKPGRPTKMFKTKEQAIKWLRTFL